MHFWWKLCAVILAVAWTHAFGGDEQKPANFDLTPNCAALLLEEYFSFEHARVRVFREYDDSILITMSSPKSLWDIPLRRYTKVETGGFQVTYYYDQKPGATHVAALPYFRLIEIREKAPPKSLAWSGKSDVMMVWDDFIAAFKLTPTIIDTYIEVSSHRLLVTDEMEPHEMGHHLAIAYSEEAAGIAKKGIPLLSSHDPENFCGEAKEHFYATEDFGLTRNFEDPDENNMVMLRLSLLNMRKFHFKEEADARAKVLLHALGCSE